MPASLIPAAILVFTIVGILGLRRFEKRIRIGFDAVCFLAVSLYFFSHSILPVFPPLQGTTDRAAPGLRALGGAWWLLGSRIDAKAPVQKKQRLRIPIIRRQWPAARKRERLTGAFVPEEHLHSVPIGDSLSARCWGLAGMRERAQKVGANLVIVSKPNLGCRAEVFMDFTRGLPVAIMECLA